MTTHPTLRIGKPDTHPSKPSHVAGVRQGNRPAKSWLAAAVNKGRLMVQTSARRSTGINPEAHDPIDPKSPRLTPA